jgi:hypothetical protein
METEITIKKSRRPGAGRKKKFENGRYTVSISVDKGLNDDLTHHCKNIGYNKSEFVNMLLKSSLYRSKKNI